MSADAIRYTIRGLPTKCVQILKAQKARSGRNIGLLVADAVLNLSQTDNSQERPSSDVARAIDEMKGWGPVRMLNAGDDTKTERHGTKHVSELDETECRSDC